MLFGMTRRSVLTAALTAAAMMVAACGDNSSPSTTAPSTNKPAEAGQKLKLAFVTNNTDDFWAGARAGAMKAAEEDGNIEVDFKQPKDGDAGDQQQIVNALITRGEQGIAISPIDPANQTKYLNDIASKVTLFCADSDAPTSNRTCYVGTDNFAAGKQAGEVIKTALPDGGKIALFVGNMDAQNAVDRAGGIKEALKGSKVEVIGIYTDTTDQVRAKANVSEVLVKNADVACLVGLYSYNGPAILSAVKDANKLGKVKIVTFDDKPEVLAGVKSGDIVATIVQQPFEFGRQSLLNMAKYIRGDKSVVPADKKVIIATRAIDKAAVDGYVADLAKFKK